MPNPRYDITVWWQVDSMCPVPLWWGPISLLSIWIRLPCLPYLFQTYFSKLMKCLILFHSIPHNTISDQVVSLSFFLFFKWQSTQGNRLVPWHSLMLCAQLWDAAGSWQFRYSINCEKIPPGCGLLSYRVDWMQCKINEERTLSLHSWNAGPENQW